jgi:hypothetical protein
MPSSRTVRPVQSTHPVGPRATLDPEPSAWRSLGSSSCWPKLGPAPAPTDRHQTDVVSRPDGRYADLIVPSPAVLIVPFPASRPALVTNIAWRHLDRRTYASGRGRTALSRLSEGGSLAASLTRTRQPTRRAGPGAKQGRTHRPGEGAQQRPTTQRRRQTRPPGPVPQTRTREQPAHTLAGPRLARPNSPRPRPRPRPRPTAFRIGSRPLRLN